jgi:hypothetical protein
MLKEFVMSDQEIISGGIRGWAFGQDVRTDLPEAYWR